MNFDFLHHVHVCCPELRIFFFFSMLELVHRCCHSISFLLDGDDLPQASKNIINVSLKLSKSHKYCGLNFKLISWFDIIIYTQITAWQLSLIIDNTHLISKHWTIICFLPPKCYCLIWVTWNSCVGDIRVISDSWVISDSPRNNLNTIENIVISCHTMLPFETTVFSGFVHTAWLLSEWILFQM